jgi:hypothetical protein
VNVSAGGLHYSWDWNGVHFVNLGIVVGADPAITGRRRYDPLDSYKFLVEDLAAKVGDSGRPVIWTFKDFKAFGNSLPATHVLGAPGKVIR